MSPLAAMAYWFQDHSIIIMLAIFSLMAIWIYWPSRKRSMDHFSRIPLEEDL